MLLLDTNALSEVVRRRPNESFVRHLMESQGEPLSASTISVFELRHGCRRHPSGDRLWERIEREVLTRVVLLPFGPAEALRAGDVYAELGARGATVGIEDVIIGATALVHGAGVVTRNVRHLGRIPGLRVLDWWR